MAIVDVTFQDDFRRVRDGDTIHLWNDLNIVEPFLPIMADNVTLNGHGHALFGMTKPLFEAKPADPDYEVVSPTVLNCVICAKKTITLATTENWGCLFRRARNARVVNVTAEVLLDSEWEWMGGFASFVTDSYFERCTMRGHINANRVASGFSAGAIRCTFIKCVNEAPVTINIDAAAGIVASAIDNVVFEECANYKRARITGEELTGGIVGHGADSIKIKCCRNRADIRGGRWVGGLAGALTWLDDAYSYHTVVSNLNTGTIYGTGLEVHGGIIGCLYNSGIIADNSNCGDIVSNGEWVGGILGSTLDLSGVPGIVCTIKNNRVRCCSITALTNGYRITGWAPEHTVSTGNLADPDIRITAGVNEEGQIYTNETVRKSDPQLGSHRKQGANCKQPCPDGACADPVD